LALFVALVAGDLRRQHRARRASVHRFGHHDRRDAAAHSADPHRRAGVSLLPLAVLELYFLARRSPSVFTRFATAALVLAAAGATSIGVYGTAVRWLR